MCGSELCLDLTASENSELAAAGGAVLVDAPNDTLVVVRTTDTTYVALSAVCTHSGCEVDFDAPSDRLTCPCHGSVFSLSGDVITGPARRALTVYAVALSGTTLTISL
jgi:cytochrome b6-f complex iron-sulfur subunit